MNIFHKTGVETVMHIFCYVNLVKIAIGAGVFFLYCMVLCSGLKCGVAPGVKGVYCSLWELLVGSCPR
jgi:hypothetical protein